MSVHLSEYLIDVETLSQHYCNAPISTLLKYASFDNITGSVIHGYHQDATDICLLIPEAANALCDAQNSFSKMNLALLIFDAYRPTKAVNYFRAWANNTTNDSEQDKMRKSLYHPNHTKSELFDLGYIIEDSDHCKGNTVDLTLIDMKTNQELAMGTRFDFMDEKSHPASTNVNEMAIANRQRLSSILQNHGFTPFEKEWWHFTYRKAQLPVTLNIDITPDLKGLGCEEFMNTINQ